MQETQTAKSIGRYELLGTLGRGSMGVVYKARDPEIGRVVAIKVLRKLLSNQLHSADASMERFRLEARSAGNLRHPNIITIFEANRDRDTPYLVMDYVEGVSLDTIISKQAPLEPRRTLYYLSQVAAGLDYAHSKGVVHRDIKPSNILVDRADNVFILDFGVATINEGFEGAEKSNPSGMVLGTPGYMSPEQILNESVDHRSDLFSLAIVAFECFTGQRPFPGDNFTAVISNILNSKPLSLTALVPTIPLLLEADFEKALARKKEVRFSSANQLIAAFASTLGVENFNAKPETVQENLNKRARRTSDWKSLFGFNKQTQTEAPAQASTQNSDTIANGNNAFNSAANPWAAHTRLDRDFVKPVADVRDRSGAIFGASSGGLYDRPLVLSSSTRSKPILLGAGIVCIILGILLLRLIFSSPSIDRVGEALEGVPEPPANVDMSLSGEVIIGKSAGSMTNSEIAALMANPQVSETKLKEALREAQTRVIPELLDLAPKILRHDSYLVRIEAIKALAHTQDKRAVFYLLPALDDHDPLVRGHAAKALGLLGDRRALSYLTQTMIREDNNEVREAVKVAIDKINGFKSGSMEN